jgi:hypothetical protein
LIGRRLVIRVVILRKRLGRSDALNEPTKSRRRFQFTLRRAFAVLTFIAVAIVFAPKLWNARLTAPRRIDLTSPGTLDLADVTVHLPIKPETIESFYVWDGGTYGVKFVDNAGANHVVASWQPLGQPEHHDEIVIGGITPHSGGSNVGKIRAAEQLIFSAIELEAQWHQSESRVMDTVYPTTGRVLTGMLRHWADRIGIGW